jgi:hypothetical protein
MAKEYRNYRPFAADGDHMYDYPETRGYLTKAIPKWITQNVLNLLPTKARTLDLLRSMGAIETGLSGWPIMRELESVFLEGFFKVNDLWEDVDSASSARSVDLVTMGMPLQNKPEITYEYWKRAYYHYSMFGMRFAFNEWDRKVLGSNFNKYMNDILKRRIDSYSMALNRLLWEHHLRGRTNAAGQIIASYLNDSKGYASNASMQDVGSIPYYLNGLGFRIGFATNVSDNANLPYPDTGTGFLHRIAAVTYHDGSYYRPESPLNYTISAPNNTNAQWGVSGTGTVSRLVFSSLPFFWFPDAPGTPLFDADSSSTNANIWFLRPPSGTDVYTIGGGDYLYSESLLKLHRQVVGALIRGYHINYSGTGSASRGRLRTDYLNSFFGVSSSNSTVPSSTIFDYGLGSIETYATTAPFLWALPEPFQFSPVIGQYLQSFVSGNPSSAFQHNHWSRILAVIRATRQPTIISARQTVSNTTFYPIYFGEYGIQTTGNPWAHSGFLSGVDTRFSLKPTVLERLHSYMRNNGAEGQKILACHPNVAIALNMYAMSNIEWHAVNKRSYGPVDFRAEFPRFGDFVIYTDLMIPDGIVYVIVPSEKSLSFAFDANDFKLKEAPTKNAVNLYMGFFIMRLLMSSAHQHGMIWGVKPDALSDM